MKNFYFENYLIIFLLFSYQFVYSQEKIVHQKISLTTENLDNKTFNKKGIFSFLKSCKSKRCEFKKNIRFGAFQSGETVTMVLDNYDTSIMPSVKRVNKNDFNYLELQSFFIDYFTLLNDGKECDKCVKRFISLYSKYVSNKEGVDTTIFQQNSSNPQAKVTFVNDLAFEDVNQFVPFPSCVYNNPPCTTYNVSFGDQTQQNGTTLYLPNNFTLTVDPNIPTINWRFAVFSFGANSTIDLSHRTATLPSTNYTKPLKNNDPKANKNCQVPKGYASGSHGPNGIPGDNGKKGKDGTNLNFHADQILNPGALWIRTDGQNGTNGGPGGDGGDGAIGSCNTGTDAGAGGSGGTGGKGGDGGDVSIVNLSTFQNGNLVYYTPAPSSGLDPSTRPGSVTGNGTGLIAIYGNPGTHGEGGYGGDLGKDAPDCKCANWANVYDCASPQRQKNNPCPKRVSRLNEKTDGKDGKGVAEMTENRQSH